MAKRSDYKGIIETLNSGVLKWYHLPPELRVILQKTVTDWIEVNPNQELPSEKILRSNITADDYIFNNLLSEPDKGNN